MFKKIKWGSLIGLTLYELTLFAGTTATAIVTYSITSIDPIAISGNPGPLNVISAKAGNQPLSAIDNSTTYAITTNSIARNIYCSLMQSMPEYVDLRVCLEAPRGCSSQGFVSLTTAPAAVVTGISQVNQGSLTITYMLTASVNARQISCATNTVIYTIGP